MKKIALNLPEELDFRFNESIKTLRTNIQLSGSKVRTILITSTIPGEGKSTIALDVAAAFANTGKKTILIDADIRKSMLIARCDIHEEVVGLSQILSGQVSVADGIYQTDVSGLDVIFSGPFSPNPTELFEDEMCADMFARLKEMDYDYIIVDTAPLGSVIDAAILAKYADGIALVAESEITRKRMLKKVLDQISRTGVRFLGVILNRVKMEKGSYYSSYYYGSGKYEKQYDGYYSK